MRGSLVHDVLYQLIRLRCIEVKFRNDIDNVLDYILKIDGMNSFRRFYVKIALSRFGSKSVNPKLEKEILKAP